MATFGYCVRPQHFLYFFPLPHGHGSLRPTLRSAFIGSMPSSPLAASIAASRMACSLDHEVPE
jgi:hypothetical protein